MSTRVLYSDLDGTMVGPGGCFFLNEDTAPTLEPARALLDLHAAGVVLVLVSGRTRAQLIEACRIFGADGFIGEMGAVLGWDQGRSSEVLRGAMPTSYDGTPAAVISRADVVPALCARYPGRLVAHAPAHLHREGDAMLRGNVDVDEVNAHLAGQDLGWLRLRDNGVLRSAPPEHGGPEHVYHLLPDGVSKGLGVARDLDRRGWAPAEAIAVGDSVSDLEMAAQVGRLFLTGNGARSPVLRRLLPAYSGVTVCAGAVGVGWAQAARAAIDDA